MQPVASRPDACGRARPNTVIGASARAQRKEVVVVERAIGPPPELDAVVDEHRERDHHRLPRLEAVDAGEDVDRVGAEDREARHEAVVRDAVGIKTDSTVRLS